MTQILRRCISALALLVLWGGFASALVVNITDRDLQGRLGYGESAGKSITVQLAPEANGPVKVFLIDDNGAVSSYSGIVQGGAVVLDNPPGATLRGVLAARGLNLVLERGSGAPASGRTFSLPGLKSAPANDRTDKNEKNEKNKK